MKQWKKMLCIMLSVIMIFSTMTICVSAQRADLSERNGLTDIHGNKSLKAEQRATLLFDMVDQMLLEENLTVDISVAGISIYLDFRSIDRAILSLKNFLSGSTFETACNTLDLGDIENVRDFYIGQYYRASSGSEVLLINNLVQIAWSNQDIIAKYLIGSLSLGIIGDFVDLSDIFIDIEALLKDMMYTGIVDSTASACPYGVSADSMIQKLVDTYLIGGRDADNQEVSALLPSMQGKTDIKAYSLYNYVENVANAITVDYLLPLANNELKYFVKDLCGYTFADENDLVGDDTNVPKIIKDNINFDYYLDGYTWGTSSRGILGEINDCVDYVLSKVWKGEDFWVGGGNEYLSSNIRTAAIKAFELFGEDILPDEADRKTLEEIKAMDTEAIVCYVAQAFIEKYIDYIVIDRECKTLEELGCYIVMHFAAEIIPGQNYKGKIDSGIKTIGKDFLIEMVTDIAVYYLKGYTPITGLYYGVGLESTMKAILNWLLAVDKDGNLGGIFQKCNTSSSDPWTVLDNTIFKMVPISLFNGVTGSKDLIMNHLVNAVLDLDFNTILSMFYKNSDSIMNKNALAFVIDIANKILSVPLNSGTVILTNVTTIDELINKYSIASIALNAINGSVGMGSDLYVSALQFITPLMGLEDSIAWLNVTAPADFENKTIDDLFDFALECEQSVHIPDDVFNTNLEDWNDVLDYECYTYVQFKSAIRQARSFIGNYNKEVYIYEEFVKAGYGDLVQDPRLGEEFGQKAINDKYYNLVLGRQNLTQREASTTQLDYIIEKVEQAGYKSSNYPARVWDNYQKAYKHALKVTNIPIYDEEDEDEEFPIAKQSMINYARRELIKAWKTMENPTADYTALEAKIAEAKLIDKTQYTADSVAIFEYVLAEAEELYATILLLSEQDEVDQMTLRLTIAMSNLTPNVVDTEIVANMDGVVIDRDRGYIYGLDAYITAADIQDYIGTSNGGEITVTTVDGIDFVGTGTKVELFNNGVLEESFEVVIFGDLSGDGAIDESDFIIIDLYNSWNLDNFDTFHETAAFFAGDLNNDECIDESDMIFIDMVNAWNGEIDQRDPYNFIIY